MLLMTLLVVTVSVVCTLATPLNITSMQPLVLNKRAAPSVKKNDYTEQQIQQIKEGHLDAIKLASMVVSQSSNPDTFDPIFQNYFQLSDREAVIDVFKQITGPKEVRTGNSLLADISIVEGSLVDGEFSCIIEANGDKANSELLDFHKDKPELVICPAAFEIGAFSGTGYPGAPVVTCAQCYPRISTHMWTIGVAMLHEYTHWYKLMSPVMSPAFKVKGTKDRVYGPFQTRIVNGFIGAEEARSNADSYAWLANEVWWTQACVDKHGPLTPPLLGDN